MYVQVCVDRPAPGMPDELTYRLPAGLRGRVQVGSYVLVSLRRSRLPGYVVEVTDQCEVAVPADVLDVLEEAPFFDAAGTKLARWVAGYYHCGLIDAILCMTPRPARRNMMKVVSVPDADGARLRQRQLALLSQPTAELLDHLLNADGEVALDAVVARFGDDAIAWCERFQSEGLLRITETVTPSHGVQMVHVAHATVARGDLADQFDSLRRRAPRQADLLEALWRAASPMPVAELLREVTTSHATLKALQRRGWVAVDQQEMYREPAAGWDPDNAGIPELTASQTVAVQEITAAMDDPAAPVLLHGVTASGKTEVYLRCIEHGLDQGMQTIVLVPEIALTAQMIGIFRARFGTRVAILHSRLSAGERYDEWRRVRESVVDVVVGARSAIFAPCARLGLIIVDEEHEQSYKQESVPRYHARDVAARRAVLSGCLLVLGSATPSVESYYHAMCGEYRLVRLAERIDNRSLPKVRVVNLRRRSRADREQSPVLSRQLIGGIGERLERREQVILFLNRRGFSSVMMCQECGHVARCDQCDVSLTYHQREDALRCHHCNYFEPAPSSCPACNGLMLVYRGTGTEKVEGEVRRLFPSAVTLRMDRDTTERRGAHERILGAFARHEADILIGTQMIAKGLDFPGVTLVGVVSADTTLQLPDFRAAEKGFQLLTQVGGRSGRGTTAGEVIVQTYDPLHYSVVSAARHDYVAFYAHEIACRRELPYPPFTYLVNIVVSDPQEAVAERRAQAVWYALTEAAGGAEPRILGPSPCPLSRLKGKYRHHLLVKDRNRPRLHKVLTEAILRIGDEDRQGVTVDVDPQSLL